MEMASVLEGVLESVFRNPWNLSDAERIGGQKWNLGRIQRIERRRRGIFVVCDDKYIHTFQLRSGATSSGKERNMSPRRGLGF